MEKAPSPFSPTLPQFQLAWDNTSITMLKSCPRKYQLAIIEGWVPKKPAAPLIFGGLLHKLLELYDTRRYDGADHISALRAVVRHALEITHERGWFYRQPDGDLTPAEPEAPGAEFLSTFWSGDAKRTRLTLIRSLIWYTEQFSAGDPLATATIRAGDREFPALEVSFRMLLPFSPEPGTQLLYCGHIDKIAKLPSNDYYIQERKHTATTISEYYFARYSIDSQTTGYLVGGEAVLGLPISGVIIDAIQVAQSFSRPQRQVISRSESQKNEWLNNLEFWITYAYNLASTYGARPWPMNENSCHNYSGCQFRKYCARSPETRQIELEADFQQRHWNPLDIRGDVE